MQKTDMKEQVTTLNLFEILGTLWRGKWVVLLITTVIVGLSVYYCVRAKNWYRADVLLKPMDSRSAEGQSSQMGVMSGLAAIAGISAGANPTAEPLAVLQSRDFTGAFITDQNLMPVLFPKLWDPVAKRWKPEVANPPDLRDGIIYFSRNVRSILEDKKTGLVTMSIEWTDPATAAEWANLLIERVNDHMRQRALSEAEANVAYLKEQLGTSSLVALQESIGRVLESELQKLLLARENREFAFRILDHASVPKLVAHPQRVLIVGGAFIVGIGISTVVLLFRNGARRRRGDQLRANSA